MPALRGRPPWTSVFTETLKRGLSICEGGLFGGPKSPVAVLRKRAGGAPTVFENLNF